MTTEPLEFRRAAPPFLLEWLLLAMALLGDGLPMPILFFPPHFVARLVIVIAFALLGLRRPERSLGLKVGYIGLCLALVLVALFAGIGTMNLVPFLLLLTVARGVQLFALSGQLVVAAVVYAMFVLGSLWQVQQLSPLRPLPLAPMGMHRPLPVGPPPPAARRLPMPEHFQTMVQHMTINSALMFGAAEVCVLLFVRAMRAEQEQRRKLALANSRLRAFALRIEDQAALQERNRIARDIHDSLGHALTALNIQMEMAQALLARSPERAGACLAEAKQLGSEALQAVRASVGALRNDPLAGRPLAEGIAELARQFEKTTGNALACRIEPLPALSQEVATAIYRLVQEGLTNICRHAGPCRAELALWTAEGGLHLLLADDGRGFDPVDNTSGFGLQGMHERVQAARASLAVESAPGQGCRLRAAFPLMEAEA